jgi:hypothetical protein
MQSQEEQSVNLEIISILKKQIENLNQRNAVLKQLLKVSSRQLRNSKTINRIQRRHIKQMMRNSPDFNQQETDDGMVLNLQRGPEGNDEWQVAEPPLLPSEE